MPRELSREQQLALVRPLKENGAWGAKYPKAYDLDENGQLARQERDKPHDRGPEL